MDFLTRRLPALVLLALLLVPAVAQPREYQIKSAFVLNFLKFVEWPSEKETLVVGVLGEHAISGELKALEAKTVRGKKVSVVPLKSVGDARSCAAVFVAETEASKVEAIVTGLKGLSVLTISDIPGFTEKGGAIGLVTERNRVRFAINSKALDAAGLKASSKLLQLAVAVR